MPYKRPTLTELRERNRNFIKTSLTSIGQLLRMSVLYVMGDVVAGMSYLHYGYLDYIAKQSNPATATDEWLVAWGALKNKTRKTATAATCTTVAFTGTSGSTVKSGSLLNRSDGYQYTLDAEVTIGTDGTGTGAITAVLPDPTDDSTGGGDDGNADSGTELTLDTAVDGVDSTVTCSVAISGGEDIEEEETFRSRVLLAFQNTPQGGSDADYREWALDVSSVTRAWVSPRILGGGTVGIYIMTDGDSTTNDGGFPTGTDGVSSSETQYAAKVATGIQLTVADYIYSLRPTTAVVYVCSPIKTSIDFTFSGLSDATSTTTTAINAAINNIFFENGEPGGKIYLSDINAAIADIDDTDGFIMTSPTANIALDTGEMPVIGTITYE